MPRRLLLALALLAFLTPAHAAERRKVIIDQDAMGGPGLQPILMLLQDPDVEVIGITTVSGDGWQPEETAATLRMLELTGHTQVPVAAGATFPLINTKDRVARREALYGPLGYKGAWTDTWPEGDTMNRRKAHAPEVIRPLPEGMPTIKPLTVSAAEFMVEATRRFPGEVTILTMGPLTNVALAQRLDDGFAARVKELVMEGGNLLGTDPTAPQDAFTAQVAFSPRMSFNHLWDPEASHIVFTGEWPRLTLVTNDASEDVYATKEVLDRATASGTRAARYVKATAEAGFPLWDEVAAAAWLDPALVTKRATMAMDVDLMPGANYGALLTWRPGKGPGLGEHDVEVVLKVDAARAQALFQRLIGR